MLKLPNETQLNTEYRVLRNGLMTSLGEKSADTLIFALEKNKMPMKMLKWLGIGMIIFGIPTIIFIVGLMMIAFGIIMMMIAKTQIKKLDIFIEKAKNDPELTH